LRHAAFAALPAGGNPGRRGPRRVRHRRQGDGPGRPGVVTLDEPAASCTGIAVSGAAARRPYPPDGPGTGGGGQAAGAVR
jgi:hypothetical protein